MKETIIEILKEMSIDDRYYDLCMRYGDLKNRYPLKRKDVEPIIKSYNKGFKYVTGDRLFLKKFKHQEHSVWLYIYFKDGLISFSFASRIEGSDQDGCWANLHKMSEYVNPDFNELTYKKTLIATTLEEAYDIIDHIFKMLDEFAELFRQKVGDIDI